MIPEIVKKGLGLSIAIFNEYDKAIDISRAVRKSKASLNSPFKAIEMIYPIRKMLPPRSVSDMNMIVREGVTILGLIALIISASSLCRRVGKLSLRRISICAHFLWKLIVYSR